MPPPPELVTPCVNCGRQLYRDPELPDSEHWCARCYAKRPNPDPDYVAPMGANKNANRYGLWS